MTSLILQFKSEKINLRKKFSNKSHETDTSQDTSTTREKCI